MTQSISTSKNMVGSLCGTGNERTMMKTLPCVLLNEQAKLPTRAYDSIGFDVYAFGDCILSPGDTKIIPLGFSAALDPGYGAFIWDRGGIGSKGIHTFHEFVKVTPEMEVIPFAGVIDPDYRGQWGVVLHNFSLENYVITHGQKIAQFVIQKCELPEPMVVESLPETNRGAKALGSSDHGTTAEQAQGAISRGKNDLDAKHHDLESKSAADTKRANDLTQQQQQALDHMEKAAQEKAGQELNKPSDFQFKK